MGHHTWALENRNQKLTPSSHGGVKGNYNLLLLLNAQGMNLHSEQLVHLTNNRT